jgi:sugar phosphate isomerase/epimerase
VISPRIAVETKSLAQPIRQALHTAGSLGVEGVQFDSRTELIPGEISDTGLRELRKLLADRNLRTSAVAFPTRGGFGDPQRLEARLAAAVEAMRLASRLGAGLLLIAVGEVPAPQSKARTILRESLTALTQQGDRLGVRPACDLSASSPQEIVDLLAELPEGTVGVDVNPARLLANGATPSGFAQAVGRHVLHVYANDAVPDRSARGAAEVQLGRGLAEIPDLLGALEEHDYRGWITIQRREGANRAAEMADAVEFLRSL